MRYDDLRSRMKNGGYVQLYRQEHDRILAGLQTQVLRRYNLLVSQLKDMDRNQLQQTGLLSTTPAHKEILGKVKHSKVLLREWNIDF